MSTRVYAYGCLPPDVGGDVAMEQLRAANRYANRLVELERERRSAKDPLVFAAIPSDLLSRQKAILARESELVQCIRGESAKARRKIAPPPEVAAELKALRAEKKDLRPRISEARTAARNANKDAIEAANESYYSAKREARASCGVYWGTYLLVEAAHELSCKACERETWCSDDPIGEPCLPRFHRFDGRGSLAVQLQGTSPGCRRAGIPGGKIIGGDDTRFRIDAVPSPIPGRGGKPRPRAWLRVGSDGRAPIWMRLPVILHRPLPPDGVVTWAKVVCKRIEARFTWELQLTVDVPAAASSTNSSTAVVSFSSLTEATADGGLVVATLEDAGTITPVTLPGRVIGALRKVDDIACIRDNHFNAARALLMAWMAERELPEWFAEATNTIGQWEAIGRLAALAIRWREGRFPGDNDAFLAIEAWRQKDKHLWVYQENLREQAYRSRLDAYRVFARRIADRYGSVNIPREDLRKKQREKMPSAHVAGSPRQGVTEKWLRRIACLSSLRLCVTQAVLASGGTIASPDGVTTVSCGSENL